MSGEEPELDCKELLQLVTSLQTLTASQQQVNINNFVSFLPDDIICECENYTNVFFSSKRRPGRVTCSWFLLTTRSLITSISRSPSPSWSLHCPCDSKHFNFTGNLFSPFNDACFVWRLKSSDVPSLVSSVVFICLHLLRSWALKTDRGTPSLRCRWVVLVMTSLVFLQSWPNFLDFLQINF